MNRARTEVPDTTGNAPHRFPLTPTLSPGERENRLPLLSSAAHDGFSKRGYRRKAFEFVQDVYRLFPLPEGEGQGEGERNFRTSPMAAFSTAASV